MKEKDVYTLEWPELEDYIANEDLMNIVNFIIEHLYQYNYLEKGQDMSLDEAVRELITEEVIPEELEKDFMVMIACDGGFDLSRCQGVLDWFCSSYKNYNYIFEKDVHLVYKAYGKADAHSNIEALIESKQQDVSQPGKQKTSYTTVIKQLLCGKRGKDDARRKKWERKD